MMTAAARPPSSLTERIAYQPETKSGSHETRLEGYRDSNHRSRIKRPRFQDRLKLPVPSSLPTETRHERGRAGMWTPGAFRGTDGSNPCFLQRGVGSEPTTDKATGASGAQR